MILKLFAGASFAAVVALIGMNARMSAMQWQQEAAIPAAALTNSVGVNVHLNYSSYAGRYDEFKALLLESGIKHIRNSMTYEDPQPSIERMQDLGKSGIKSDLVFDSRTSAAQMQSFIQTLRPALEIVEGTNEYDLTRKPDWSDHVIAYQKTLYGAAHALGMPVIGPSLTTNEAYAKVGDLHAYLDYGNMHNYFSGFNPGTVGWGGAYHGNLYGSLAYNMRVAQAVSENKPIMSTETGYCTLAAAHNAVTPEIAARYLPRLYLEQWLAHVPRTYVYEFMDEGQPGCDSNLGLVTHVLEKKPGYVAVQSLLHDLAQSRPLNNHARLSFHLQGNMQNIHHVLVQTADHHLQLFIWNESPSWNVDDGLGQPFVVAARDIDFAVHAPWKIMREKSISDSGDFQDEQIFPRVDHTTLSIADRITIVDIRN